MKVIYQFSIFNKQRIYTEKVIDVCDNDVRCNGVNQAIEDVVNSQYKVFSIDHFRKKVKLAVGQTVTEDIHVVPYNYKEGEKRYITPQSFKYPKHN